MPKSKDVPNAVVSLDVRKNLGSATADLLAKDHDNGRQLPKPKEQIKASHVLEVALLEKLSK